MIVRRKMFKKLAFLLFNINLVYSQAPQCGTPIANQFVEEKHGGGYIHPWFALLTSKATGETSCTGSLINENYVLTAAHCFNSLTKVPKEQLYQVVLGIYNGCAYYESSRMFFDVEKVFIHRRYNPNKRSFDIALIKLKSPAPRGWQICLPPPGRRQSSEPATLAGFGVTNGKNLDVPCYMREANITKFNRRACIQRVRAHSPQGRLGRNVFCAGHNNRKAAAICFGDAEGPLMTRTRDGRYILAGIASDGYKCGNLGHPRIYTDVAAYLYWIYTKMAHLPTLDELTAGVELPIIVPLRSPVKHRNKGLFRNKGLLRNKGPLEKYKESKARPLATYHAPNQNITWKAKHRANIIKKVGQINRNTCEQSCRCGIPDTRSRLAGGWEPPAHKYPSMVLINVELAQGTSPCVGTLISDRYVLTAAHCFNDYLDNKRAAIRKTKVRLGEHYNGYYDWPTWEMHNVENIIIHEGYSKTTHDNDIALLKLDKRVKFNETIGTACLPKLDEFIEGKIATITGYGRRSAVTPASYSLLEVHAQVLTKQQCIYTKRKWSKVKVSDNMVCAANVYNQNVCFGDSGGVLMNPYNQQMVVIGIASFAGAPCVNEHQPSVFTRVIRYLDWIAWNTQDSCYCSQY